MKPINQKEIQKEILQLYKYKTEVKKLLISLGCEANLAEDLFQEALIIYLQKKRDDSFDFTYAPIHYIKQTCKFLWYSEARKNQRNPIVSGDFDFTAEEQNWFEKEQKMRLMEAAFEQLGKQCKELLQLFYGLGKSMVEIAKKLDLRNEKVAKAQKYRCIQKAKELVGSVSIESLNA